MTDMRTLDQFVGQMKELFPFFVPVINLTVKNLVRCRSRRLVHDGEIYKPPFCENCGKRIETQIHHWKYDFEHSNDVTFLCAECHYKEHHRTNEEDLATLPF